MLLWWYKDTEKQYAGFALYILIPKTVLSAWFLVLTYNIFNNWKEKKSKKNPCQKTYVKAEYIRIFVLKYFRSALAIQKNNWNLGNVVKILHFNKMKYIKKENTQLKLSRQP